jgi:transposase
MLNDFTCQGTIYLACGYTDLRKGIDGLALLVEQQFKMTISQHDLFLFCGRRTDRIKGLLWEGDGFLLVYKRLEEGQFKWPRKKEELECISQQQYRYLMSGLQIEQNHIPRYHKPLKMG